MRKSIVNKIIIIFLIVTIASTIVLTYLFIREENRTKEVLIKSSILKLAEEKAQTINLIFKNIENETQNLGYSLQILMESEVKPGDLKEVDRNYKRDSRGVLGRITSTHKSNVFLSNDIELNDEIRKEIYITEKLDPIFKKIKTNNPEVEWVYFTSKNNVLRLYPYLSNDIFDADHKHYKDPFFTIADEKNNPQRKVVWSSPYYDYAGKGWVLTCSYPVYIDNELVMVASLDITLNSIENLIANFKLAETGFAFLVDETGNVIYHPHFIPSRSERGNVLSKNLITHSKGKSYKEAITRILEGDKSVLEYTDDFSGETFLIAGVKINNEWMLGIQVNKKDYMLNFINFFPTFTAMALIVIITAIILGTYLFYRISIPISLLAKETRKIASGQFGEVIDIHSDDEIGQLSRAFNEMSLTIKERTENLEKSKQQLEAIFNSITELFFICKPDYSLVMVNNNAKKLYQNVDEAVRKGEKCYRIFRKRGNPCPDCPVEITLKHKKSYKKNVVVDKQVYSVDATPIINKKGEIEQIIIYSKDITRSVIMDKTVSHREKLAELGQMTGGIIHELKNPMSVIKGSTYLLKSILAAKTLKQEDVDDIIFAVNEIEKSVDYSQRVISNVLEFTKKSSREREKISVKEVIKHILLILNQKIIDHDIKVEIEIKDDVVVYMNIDSLKHILINVISNAFQAMPKGGSLKITALPTDNKKWVEIKITDTGHGIKKEDLEKVFEPYFTTREKGIGLGLWITKNEVERNGGQIKVKSQPGKHTTFIIILPSGKGQS